MRVEGIMLRATCSIFGSTGLSAVTLSKLHQLMDGAATGLQTPKNSKPSPRELIEDVLRSKHPGTVVNLAQIVLAENNIDEVDFVATVKAMAEDGAIVLQAPSYEIESVSYYLLTPTLSGWLWLTTAATALAIVAVTLTPDFFPLNIPKLLLGSIFAFYLPGYTLLQLLFPKGSEIDALQRFVLSIGTSLAITPLIGLLLTLTPWGIRFASITASLGAFTIILAIAAATREYVRIRKEV